jgi:hypothetical protein
MKIGDLELAVSGSISTRGRARLSTNVAWSIPIPKPTPTRKHPLHGLNNLQRFSEGNATITDEWGRRTKNYEALVAALAFSTISGVPALSLTIEEIFPAGIDQVAGRSALC